MSRLIPEDSKYLLLELSRRYNIALEDLINRRHKQETTLRVVLVRALRDLGFSLLDIGKLLGRNHTTIMHLLNHQVDRTGELYVQIFELSKNAYTRRLHIQNAVIKIPKVVKDDI